MLMDLKISRNGEKQCMFYFRLSVKDKTTELTFFSLVERKLGSSSRNICDELCLQVLL